MVSHITHFVTFSLSMGLLGLALIAHADAELSVNKTVDNTRPAPGNPVEFTVTITNNGPGEATGIEVTDRLPHGLTIPAGMAVFTSQGVYDPLSGLWDVGLLPAFETAVMKVPALPELGTAPACHVNMARLTSSDAGNSDLSNDWSLAPVYSDTALDCARLTLVIRLVEAPRTGSPTVTLDMEVWNDGPDTAKGLGIRLSGVENAGNLRTDSLFGDLLPAHVLKGTVSWTYDCGISAFTESYTLTIYTETTPASDSVLRHIGTISVPRSGACNLPDALEEGFAAGGCFIATAAYGSELHVHVDTLRRFRDDYLLKTALGRKIVDFYYRASPPIAEVIARHEFSRLITRLLLSPLIYAISYPFVFFPALVLGVTCLKAATKMRRENQAPRLRRYQ